MNFEIASDIHVRYFGDLGEVFFQPKSPVLVILGDLCEFGQIIPCFRIFERMAETWDHVLYVLGNHEFYGATLSDRAVNHIKRVLDPIKNLTVLEKDTILIQDTYFIGCTLWSSMQNNNPVVANACHAAISDYMFISVSDYRGMTRRLVPDDTVKYFNKSLKFIKKALKNANPSHQAVVLTHHAPTYLSVSDKFRGSIYNGAFVSDLGNFIVDNPQIRIWAHGHVHSDHDYKVADTRVVCHPLGYNRELYCDSHTYTPMLIEV